MEETPNKRGGSGGVVLAVSAILVVLPLLYVLSIGPLVWLDSQSYFSASTQNVLGVIYYPVGWTINSDVPLVSQSLKSYVELWD